MKSRLLKYTVWDESILKQIKTLCEWWLDDYFSEYFKILKHEIKKPIKVIILS